MARSKGRLWKHGKSVVLGVFAVLLFVPLPVAAYTITFGSVDNSQAMGGVLEVVQNTGNAVESGDVADATVDISGSGGTITGRSTVYFTILGDGSHDSLNFAFLSSQITTSNQMMAGLYSAGGQIGSNVNVNPDDGESINFNSPSASSGSQSWYILFTYGAGVGYYSQATATSIAFR